MVRDFKCQKSSFLVNDEIHRKLYPIWICICIEYRIRVVDSNKKKAANIFVCAYRDDVRLASVLRCVHRLVWKPINQITTNTLTVQLLHQISMYCNSRTHRLHHRCKVMPSIHFVLCFSSRTTYFTLTRIFQFVFFFEKKIDYFIKIKEVSTFFCRKSVKYCFIYCESPKGKRKLKQVRKWPFIIIRTHFLAQKVKELHICP